MEVKEHIVVIGFGWVGQANALSFVALGHPVSYFDPSVPPLHYHPKHAALYDRLEKLEHPRAKDSPETWYLVCVGDHVSEEGHQDLSNIKRALESLEGAEGGVILRSTVLPDLLEDLPFDYYLPEFLHEKKAVEESIEPYFFVVGTHSSARPEPRFFALLRSRAHKHFTGTPEEASLIKYLSNLWNALRVSFVNEFGHAMGHPTSSHELERINRVLGFLFNNRSYLRYGRAYGGNCLPKDSRAFIAWYKKKNRDLPLIRGMHQANEHHRAREEAFPLMPEWYSEWSNAHISGWKALRELGHAIKKQLRRLA